MTLPARKITAPTPRIAKAGNGLRQAGHEEERRKREDGDQQQERQKGTEREEGRRREFLVEIQRDADEEQAGQRRRRADLSREEGLPVGERRQGFHLRKLPIMARPSFWLFSGWNWVPAMLPRATTAVTDPP